MNLWDGLVGGSVAVLVWFIAYRGIPALLDVYRAHQMTQAAQRRAARAAQWHEWRTDAATHARLQAVTDPKLFAERRKLRAGHTRHF